MEGHHIIQQRPMLAWLGLVLVALGIGARFWDLGRMVVWHDEAFSVVRVLGFDHDAVLRDLYTAGRDLSAADLLRYQTPDPTLGWADAWHAMRGHPEHAPLFYLLARMPALAADTAIVGIRATSALLSALLIPAMAWFAWELFQRRSAVWLAAIVVSVAPLHLLYAQEAREYALLAAIVASSSAAFLRALRRDSWAAWSLYAALVALGLYTHLLIGLSLAAHALYGLAATFTDRMSLRRFARGYGFAVGAALLAFVPWILVMLDGLQALRHFTAWMTMPARPGQLLTAWAAGLSRPFVDLPAWPLAWLAVMPLLGVAFWYRERCRDGRLLWLMVLVPFVVVAGPDLMTGGRRSLEARYLMPAFLAIELLVAGALNRGLASGPWSRRVATVALATLVALGLASQWRILQAESWWSKSYSGRNAAFARLVNVTDRPMLLASAGDVNLGELLSLAYHLDGKVRLRLREDISAPIPADVTALFALLPGDALRRGLEDDYDIHAFDGTWQWFVLTPRISG